jgi:hypothetical protein
LIEWLTTVGGRTLHRRVREEEFEDGLSDESEPKVIYGRELSLVPERRRASEPHDAQTAALIRRLAELERLPHGEPVSKLLKQWQWLDRMKSPQEKQQWLARERHPDGRGSLLRRPLNSAAR